MACSRSLHFPTITVRSKLITPDRVGRINNSKLGLNAHSESQQDVPQKTLEYYMEVSSAEWLQRQTQN